MSNRLTKEYFENLCYSRNHLLTSFENYTGVKSNLSFKCLICGHEWTSRAHSYLNSKTGCWGCKKRKISSVQKGKQVASSTRELLSAKAKARTSHWHQLSEADWHRIDTLYLVDLLWEGRTILKVGRSFSGSDYHRTRLSHVYGEWQAPSFWVWWVESMVKRIFYEYKYVRFKPEDLDGLVGYSECFTDRLDPSRVITVIERFMTWQSAAKPLALQGNVQRLPG